MITDEMTKILLNIQSDVSSTKAKVDSHDVLLKEYKNDLSVIHEKIDDVYTRTYNLDSWKNRLETFVIEEKEKAKEEVQSAFNERIKPLEDDYKARQDNKTDTKTRTKDLTWDVIKTGTLLFIGYMATKIKLFLIAVASFLK